MLKMCEFNGCHNLIEHGRYCSEHQRHIHKHKPKSIYHHDNKPVYRSEQWKSVCLMVDLREHDRCQRCGKIVFGKDKQHHHIIPIKKNPQLEFDPDNIMLLCAKCHPIVEHEQEKTKPKIFPKYFQSPPYQK
jgi:5-methylcytosine-specific restriction endonuclease McrA